MKHLITSLLILCCSCSKVNTWWQSGSAVNLFPPTAAVSLSYASIGNVQLTGLTAIYISDTLTISAHSQSGAMKLWIKTASIKDTTVDLNGTSGSLQLFDQQGNEVGYSIAGCSITLSLTTDGKLSGSIGGMMNNVTTSPPVTAVSGDFSNLFISGNYRH